jgi:hypothetical protein
MKATRMIVRKGYDDYQGDKAELLENLVNQVLEENPDAVTISVIADRPEHKPEPPQFRAARGA